MDPIKKKIRNLKIASKSTFFLREYTMEKTENFVYSSYTCRMVSIPTSWWGYIFREYSREYYSYSELRAPNFRQLLTSIREKARTLPVDIVEIQNFIIDAQLIRYFDERCSWWGEECPPLKSLEELKRLTPLFFDLHNIVLETVVHTLIEKLSHPLSLNLKTEGDSASIRTLKNHVQAALVEYCTL